MLPTSRVLMLMFQAIVRVVVGNLQQAEFFTIMADDCIDSANKEHLILYFRYVDNYVVHKEFIWLSQCPNIQDTLLRFNLRIFRC